MTLETQTSGFGEDKQTSLVYTNNAFRNGIASTDIQSLATPMFSSQEPRNLWVNHLSISPLRCTTAIPQNPIETHPPNYMLANGFLYLLAGESTPTVGFWSAEIFESDSRVSEGLSDIATRG